MRNRLLEFHAGVWVVRLLSGLPDAVIADGLYPESDALGE